jgi:PAS domain S-box-containing protein
MVASKTRLNFLAGGSEIEALIQKIDWSETSLGPIELWPQSLKISVRIILGSRYPMFLWWGEELILLYNEAYARMTLAAKHPWALGRSAREVWAEIWGDLGPRADEVMVKGQATWDEELLLVLERNGFPEETYHTFSYSPIPDDQGGIGGLLCAVTEETKQVLGRRRLRTLRELAARTTEEAKTVQDACRTAIQALSENAHDLPFALIYLLDADHQRAALAEATGLLEDSVARPATVEFMQVDERGWPLRVALASMHSELVGDLAERFGMLPGNVWPDPPQRAIVLPIKQPNLVELAGFLVVGLSPRLAFDDDYRGFLELTAGHIGTAIANAQAYEAERQRAEALTELDRAKTVFFNNISHEFRTPLTLMLGPLEESLAEKQEPAVRQRLELIYRNGLRMQKLVNTLLDFSRMEAGRLRASYEAVDLAALTLDLASVFRSAVEKAGLRLVVDCPPLPERIYVDRDKWEQIVLNLISNAFKFTLAGEIEVTLRDAGDMVQFAVRDTGSGIHEDQLPHIFERFHRVEGVRARSLEGTGIGLAFVSELAHLHGGTVGVESLLGQGSTFTVTLPKGKAHLPPEQIEDGRTQAIPSIQTNYYVEEALRWIPESGADGIDARTFTGGNLPKARKPGTFRIILADDNADMRDYMRRLLVDKYEVEALADGVTALAAVRRQPPDLLLADVMMPGLDGFGLLQAIRSDEALKTLPVILLSARAGEEAKVEGFDAGADDYLVKPFGARELLARISAQLELAHVRRETIVALRRRAEEFRAHFNLTTAGNVQADAESGRFLLVNDAMCQMIGYSEIELLGRTIWDITDPRDREENEHLLAALMRGERLSFEFEKRFIRKDGELRWGVVSVTIAQRDEAGKPLRIGAVVLDITHRKQVEESLRQMNESLERRVEERTAQVRESEERFRALVDASAQIVWTMDRYGRVAEDSPSWRVFTGRSYEESKGWGWMDAVHPSDRELTFRNWRFSMANAVPMDMELRIAHHSGAWNWMQVRAVPLYDEKGSVRGWVGMNIDIHQRKQAEADRERLARSLVMAEQEERRRLSQMLHDDLQQLLYATHMRIAMVGQDLEAAGQASLAEDIDEARIWLRQCVDTTRQMTVELSPPILKNEGLVAALEWLQPQMERRHGLKTVIHAEGDFLIADEDMRVLLFQVVRELLFNVAKHAGVERATVTLGQEEDKLAIHVIDEGQGFDSSMIGELKGQKGSFGLFSVHERLRLVGGRMEVDSAPGVGTHVILRAPIRAEEKS